MWTKTLPTKANVGQLFWTRRIDNQDVRIAEVDEYNNQIELSFTKAETAKRLGAFEFIGPITPPV
jgi:hypothetical protein